MISKYLKDLREPLDISLQILAEELDTSAKRIKYIAVEECDALLREKVEALVEGIKSSGEVASLDDNTVMYEYSSEPIVIHSHLGAVWLLFGSYLATKVESALI